MTCQRARSQLEDYVDDELSPADAEQVRKHLEECRRCREEFLASQRLKQLLKQTPRYDPGRDYWSDTARLIRARTVDIALDDGREGRVTTGTVGTRGNALVRALVSLAASLFVLISAILLGFSQDESVSRRHGVSAPILATAPVSELLGTDNGPVVTQPEQVRLAKGMLLMGAPGFLGRFAGLPDLMVTGEER